MSLHRAVALFLALTVVPSVAAAQQPCTTDGNQVVSELYRHMLERGVDPGSAHWTRELQSGRATVRDVVGALANSPEYTKRFWYQEDGEEAPYVRSVNRLYRHLLARQPDSAGARRWAQLGRRSGPAAVIAEILDSREYDEQFGDWGVPGSGGIAFCGSARRDTRDRRDRRQRR